MRLDVLFLALRPESGHENLGFHVISLSVFNAGCRLIPFSICYIAFFICHCRGKSPPMTNEKCNMANGKCFLSYFVICQSLSISGVIRFNGVTLAGLSLKNDHAR